MPAAMEVGELTPRVLQELTESGRQIILHGPDTSQPQSQSQPDTSQPPSPVSSPAGACSEASSKDEAASSEAVSLAASSSSGGRSKAAPQPKTPTHKASSPLSPLQLHSPATPSAAEVDDGLSLLPEPSQCNDEVWEGELELLEASLRSALDVFRLHRGRLAAPPSTPRRPAQGSATATAVFTTSLALRRLLVCSDEVQSGAGQSAEPVRRAGSRPREAKWRALALSATRAVRRLCGVLVRALGSADVTRARELATLAAAVAEAAEGLGSALVERLSLRPSLTMALADFAHQLLPTLRENEEALARLEAEYVRRRLGEEEEKRPRTLTIHIRQPPNRPPKPPKAVLRSQQTSGSAARGAKVPMAAEGRRVGPQKSPSRRSWGSSETEKTPPRRAEEAAGSSEGDSVEAALRSALRDVDEACDDALSEYLKRL